jgi:hypothetical protein
MSEDNAISAIWPLIKSPKYEVSLPRRGKRKIQEKYRVLDGKK